MNSISASAQHHVAASQVIAGGVNSNVRLANGTTPLCFSHGMGCKLYDLDGNEYIDYALGMGPALFGHAPRFLIEAVGASLQHGQVFAGQSPLELSCATLLRQFVPSAELVRIGCTGSEMVHAALRVARAFKGAENIIKFEGHYHGWLDGVLLNQSGPPNDPLGQTPFPRHVQSLGQSRNTIQGTVIMPWNRIEPLARYLESNAADTAAVIMEPIMCNTGVIPPRSGFLQDVRELCTRYNVVLIFDEVITGLRMGPGGAQGKFGVRPDLSVFAKALGGGFPVAALVGRADIMGLIASGQVTHSGTYNANLVSLAGCFATLEHLRERGGEVYSHVETLGRMLIDGIRELARSYDSSLRVSGYPAVFHTYFSSEAEPTDYFSYCRTNLEKQRQFIRALARARVRPMSRGTWFMSTAHTKVDIDATLEAIGQVLHAERVG